MDSELSPQTINPRVSLLVVQETENEPSLIFETLTFLGAISGEARNLKICLLLINITPAAIPRIRNPMPKIVGIFSFFMVHQVGDRVGVVVGSRVGLKVGEGMVWEEGPGKITSVSSKKTRPSKLFRALISRFGEIGARISAGTSGGEAFVNTL